MKKKPVKTEKKRPSGWAALKAAGKTGILIAYSDEHLAIIDEAAAADGRTRPNFIMHYALQAAIDKRKGKSKERS